MGKEDLEKVTTTIEHAKTNDSFDLHAVDTILTANNLSQSSDAMKSAGIKLERDGVLPGLVLDAARQGEFQYLSDKGGSHLDKSKVEEAARTGEVDGHHISPTGQFVANMITERWNQIDTKGSGSIGQGDLNDWARRDGSVGTLSALSADGGNRQYAGGNPNFDEGGGQRLQPTPEAGPEVPPPIRRPFPVPADGPPNSGERPTEPAKPGGFDLGNLIKQGISRLPGTERVFDPVKPPGIDDRGGFNASGSDKYYDIDNRTVRSHPDAKTGGTAYSYDGTLTDKGKNGEHVHFNSNVVVRPDGRIDRSVTEYNPPADQTYAGEGLSHDRDTIVKGENKFTIHNVTKVSTYLGPDGGTRTNIETADGKKYSMKTDSHGKVVEAAEDQQMHLY